MKTIRASLFSRLQPIRCRAGCTAFPELLFAILLVSAMPSSAHADEDDCIEEGGTAHCVAPELGQYRYDISFPPHGLGGTGPDDASALGAAEQVIRTSYDACTLSFTDNRASVPPVPTGQGGIVQGSASDALYGSGAPFLQLIYTLSSERHLNRIPIVMEMTYPKSGTPACRYSVTGRLQAIREREVACPDANRGLLNSYRPDSTVSYCFRTPAQRVLSKNLGCGAGSPTLGNPTNPAIRNKVQVETDYVGAGPMPLRFVRTYNSLLYVESSPPGAHARGYWSRLGPNWRSTYDRAIRFSNSPLYPTAFAYRQDGRTLTFKLVNGQFVPDADVIDQLVRLTDAAGNVVGWRYSIAETEEIEAYDTAGNLQSITDRSGLTHGLSYDGSARLSSVTDSFGRALTFTYDANNRLQTMTDPANNIYTYTYNVAGSITSVVYPGGESKSYVYNEAQHTSQYNQPYALTGIVDESGSRFAIYKYALGNVVESTEHAGGAYKYQFSSSGAVTDPLNVVRTYLYKNIHGVAKNTSVNQPCAEGCGSNSAAATTYDANGNVASRTDFSGVKTCYAHDQARNLETVRLEGFPGTASCPSDLAAYSPAAGSRERKISTQWHPAHRLPTKMDEPGRRTSYTHDANGNVLTRTITDLSTTPNTSRTWTYTYNAFGKVLTADGPRTDISDLITYTYYNCATGYHCGQLHTITNAAGHTTTYNTYNAHGQPLTITDPNGVMTTLTYDLRQRLKSRTVGSEVTTFDYWPTGLLKKVTLQDGSYLEYTYDPAHRLTDINDADGNRIHYTLDAMGNRTGEESFDPSNDLAQKRTRVFDTLSRLHKEIGAAGTAAVTTTFGYDNNGNQTSIAAPLGRDTTQGYDELNRLTQVTDPLSGVTHYGYNALDQLISVTDPKGLVTSYDYNGLGDLQQQTSPDTGVIANTYDSGGNLWTSTDARNVVTTYTYDALNRVTTTSFAQGATIDQTLTYAYDAGTYGKGRLTGASDADHSLAWTYDEQGRVVTATQTVGAVSKTAGYSYLNGQRHSLTTPSGQVITYGYTNGKVTSVSVNGTVLVSNVLHEPFGPVRQWTWGNGTLSVRTFDDDGKITQIDSGGLKTYSYDDAFRITGITDAGEASLSWAYDYDDLDRLTSASKTGTTLGYSYDANGNRLTQTGSGASTFTIAPNSNRLTGTSGALTRTYSYDGAGNATSFGGITFAYNNRGRMKSSTWNGIATSYTYNALGQLIKKGSSALYYYDDAGHLLGIYDSSGSLTEEIVWLGDIPLATLRPNAGGIDVYYIHSDHLNTPRLITDASSNSVRWRWDADPFGVGEPNEDPSGLGAFTFGLRFPGQMYVAEAGLYYNYYRDGYDPVVGRYTQSDPVGLYGGLNTYAYAESDPIRNADPKGLNAVAAPVAVGGICVAGCAAIQSCRDAARNFIQSVRSNPVIDPDRPITPQLPGYIDPGLTCPTTQADSCPPMREPPSPRDRCVNAVNLRFAACLGGGRNPLICQTQRIFGLIFCNSSSPDDSGE